MDNEIADAFPPDLYLIRLQGPWVMLTGEAAVPRTVRLPLSAGWDDGTAVGGGVRLERNFQRPTNLDADERVLLVLPPGAVPTAVQIGGRDVGGSRCLEQRRVWDVTDYLQPSNRLRLEFDDGAGLAALREPVLLGVMPDADGSWWASLRRA